MESETPARLPEPIRYWEPRRYIYNAILAIIIVGWVVLTWPHFNHALTLQAILFLIVLALGANFCYSAVYLVDIPLQHSPLAAFWRRWRWVLWLVGMLLAILFLNYWIADEIYPYVP